MGKLYLTFLPKLPLISMLPRACLVMLTLCLPQGSGATHLSDISPFVTGTMLLLCPGYCSLCKPIRILQHGHTYCSSSGQCPRPGSRLRFLLHTPLHCLRVPGRLLLGTTESFCTSVCFSPAVLQAPRGEKAGSLSVVLPGTLRGLFLETMPSLCRATSVMG